MAGWFKDAHALRRIGKTRLNRKDNFAARPRPHQPIAGLRLAGLLLQPLRHIRRQERLELGMRLQQPGNIQ